MTSVAGASGSSAGKQKTSWPEVVGLLAEEAVKVIKKDMPKANVEVLPSDEPASMDLVADRVRVFVDTVSETPSTELEPAGRKISWPEVVGLSVEEAKEVILKKKPDADIEVLPAGAPVTMDLMPNRVRIFVDTVVVTPFVG